MLGFFLQPKNLAAITPPELDFQVLSDLPPAIHPGMMIEYRVRPLLGIPMTWLTEITHVDGPRYFVDEQRIGPYAISGITSIPYRAGWRADRVARRGALRFAVRLAG